MTELRPVVIAAGGTGGHIYPAIAVATELAKRKMPVIWVGTAEGLESRLVPEANIELRPISIAGLRGKGIKGLIVGPFKLVGACVQSMKILKDVQACSVLGMGGFVSGPVGIAALFTRRPLVLHEQNAIAGMTNRWLGRFATRVFSAMPKVFPATVGARAVGNPVRESIENVCLGKDRQVRSSLRLLIIGGSRGARALNQVVPEAVKVFQQTNNESLGLDVWHQTGVDDEKQVSDAYNAFIEQPVNEQGNAKVSAKVQPYIQDVTKAYQWADLVICRAGAMTVSELSAAGLPSVLVPFPFAVDDHQTMNARYLSDAGAAYLLPQSDMHAENLAQRLTELAGQPELLLEMSAKARQMYKPNAASIIADALVEECQDGR
jgi:UDP-N-acetylglucosamine--N-acetylmuramyl-(pentapeptide) pyrophosphoryl-undecaprenol N-acetylglucosamine transferase